MLLQKHGCHLGLGTIAQSGCMRKGGVIRVLFVPTHASRVATTRFQSRIRAVESCSDDGDSHTAIGVERQTRAPASVEDHKFTIHGAVYLVDYVCDRHPPGTKFGSFRWESFITPPSPTTTLQHTCRRAVDTAALSESATPQSISHTRPYAYLERSLYLAPSLLALESVAPAT